MDHGIRPEHFALLRQLDGVARTSGDPAQDQTYETLVEAYEATAIWARAVQQRLFADGLVRKLSRPTDMAQKFKPYTWVRIYPRRNAPKALAYTVGIDAVGEFCVKLDTVQMTGTAVRHRYDELRHNDNHLSPFAAIISEDEGLAMSFEALVDWSIDAIGRFEPSYDALALDLGLIEPRMRLITDPAQSRAAFARWAEVMAGGSVGAGVFQVPDHKVWMNAADAAPGIDARLGVDSSGSEWRSRSTHRRSQATITGFLASPRIRAAACICCARAGCAGVVPRPISVRRNSYA